MNSIRIGRHQQASDARLSQRKHLSCPVSAINPLAPFRRILVSFSEQHVLGLVDLGGEEGGAAAVGVHLHHQLAMGAADVVLAGALARGPGCRAPARGSWCRRAPLLLALARAPCPRARWDARGRDRPPGSAPTADRRSGSPATAAPSRRAPGSSRSRPAKKPFSTRPRISPVSWSSSTSRCSVVDARGLARRLLRAAEPPQGGPPAPQQPGAQRRQRHGVADARRETRARRRPPAPPRPRRCAAGAPAPAGWPSCRRARASRTSSSAARPSSRYCMGCAAPRYLSC